MCCINSLATRSKLISSMAILWMWENMMLFKWFCPPFDLTQGPGLLSSLDTEAPLARWRQKGIMWYSMSNEWISGLPTFCRRNCIKYICKSWLLLVVIYYFHLDSSGCIVERLMMVGFLWVSLPMPWISQMETSLTLPAHLPRWRQKWEGFRCYEETPCPLVGTIRHNFSNGSNICCRLEGTSAPLPPASRAGAAAPCPPFRRDCTQHYHWCAAAHSPSPEGTC